MLPVAFTPQDVLMPAECPHIVRRKMYETYPTYQLPSFFMQNNPTWVIRFWWGFSLFTLTWYNHFVFAMRSCLHFSTWWAWNFYVLTWNLGYFWWKNVKKQNIPLNNRQKYYRAGLLSGCVYKMLGTFRNHREYSLCCQCFEKRIMVIYMLGDFHIREINWKV